MSTYQSEMAKKGRPMGARAGWELRAMVKALKLHSWLNTEEDKARLAEAERELKLRRKEARNG